jgi:hypothetical protein
MRRKLEPGEWAAIGLLSGGLSLSAVLVAAGYEPTSTCVRRSTLARAVVLILTAHLCLELEHDPLTWIGHRIEDACRAMGLHQPLG